MKNGRQTGIFNTWPECEKQVTGFTGAVFKSFKSRDEAESFVQGKVTADSKNNNKKSSYSKKTETDNYRHKNKKPKLLKQTTKPENSSKIESDSHLRVYTDGNHYKGSDSKGYGIYTEWKGKIYSFSQRVTPSHLTSFFHLSDAASRKPLSNPTMELAAAVHTISLAASSPKVDNKTLIIAADYTGVKEWLTGGWKAKEQHIIELKNQGLLQIKKATENGWKIQFEKVKGHSGDKGNDLADILAKGGKLNGSSDLSLLFSSF